MVKYIFLHDLGWIKENKIFFSSYCFFNFFAFFIIYWLHTRIKIHKFKYIDGELYAVKVASIVREQAFGSERVIVEFHRIQVLMIFLFMCGNAIMCCALIP